MRDLQVPGVRSLDDIISAPLVFRKSNANTTDRERWVSDLQEAPVRFLSPALVALSLRPKHQDFHAYNTPIGPRIAFLGITYRNGTDPDGALMQEDLVKVSDAADLVDLAHNPCLQRTIATPAASTRACSLA